MSHYVFLSTHEPSFTTDMAVLLWCILTDQHLNLPRHIRHAIGHVQIAGNLPFPALVSDLVSAARVFYKAGDTKTMIPQDDQYLPNGKYIRPTATTTSRTVEPAEDVTPPSTSQELSTNQLLLQIIQRLDRLDWQEKRRERRNKRQFTYLKELIVGNYPPEEEPDTPDSTLPTSTGSHDNHDGRDAVTSPPLFLTDGTEDGANL